MNKYLENLTGKQTAGIVGLFCIFIMPPVVYGTYEVTKEIMGQPSVIIPSRPSPSPSPKPSRHHHHKRNYNPAIPGVPSTPATVPFLPPPSTKAPAPSPEPAPTSPSPIPSSSPTIVPTTAPPSSPPPSSPPPTSPPPTPTASSSPTKF